MSGPSRREEQDRRSQQPVKRFSLKGLFNKLTGLLGIRALFNFFARPRGPRPVPIKIDPAWFPVPHTVPSVAESNWTPPWADTSSVLPPWQPPWVQAVAPSSEGAPESPHDDDYVDEYAFVEDNPGWDEEPPEPEEDTITVKPGERIPTDAGEVLRTYYAPGVGDVRVYARLDPNEMDLDPDQIIERGALKRDFNLHFGRKGPKKPE